MLLCLLTAQRCQTLSKLDIKLMQKLPGKYVFTIGEKLKTTRQGKHLEPIELADFEPDINLSVVTHLNQYLAKTETLRGFTSQLLISYVKLHKAVSNTTIGKWCKSVLRDAVIIIIIIFIMLLSEYIFLPLQSFRLMLPCSPATVDDLQPLLMPPIPVSHCKKSSKRAAGQALIHSQNITTSQL